MTLVRVLVATALLAIATAGTVTLLQRAPRRSGTNLTGDVGPVLSLDPAQKLCEPGELLPGDTGAIKLHAVSDGTPTPALAVTISSANRTISTGTLPGGWRQGAVSIPVSRVPRTIPVATVCVSNRGSRRVSFGGSVPDANFVIELAGRPVLGRLRVEYMRPGSESWLQLLPTLAHRFSLAKSDLLRHGEAFAALLLMLLAVGLATKTMLGEDPAR
ncbi:MAG TPA: hypothetical protein VNR42_01420 [Solirubrobacteraceae bacterium]|nr:hypothetical protein [Solirubrobacteraceae bacterium]